jgi:hypothetical protein
VTLATDLGVEYEVWLCQPDGTHLASLDRAQAFEYTNVANDVGRFSVSLPWDFDLTLLQKDQRVNFIRKAIGGTLVKDFTGLVTKIEHDDDQSGQILTVISGPSLNGLVTRRICAAAAGHWASKLDAVPADDALKALMRRNFGETAAAARQLDTEYFNIEANAGAGPAVTRSFAWRAVKDVMKDVCDAAREAGTEVFWQIVSTSIHTIEFRTYIGQPGTNRGLTGTTRLTISKEQGNLKDAMLTIDYDNEANYIYCGGQGQADARTIKTAEDVTRSGASLFARSEDFADARQDETDNGVQAAADAALIAGRPLIRFSGEIVDQPGTRYGLNWFWGDRVSAYYVRGPFDCLIRSVHVSMSDQGVETIDAKLEAYL